MDKHENGEHQKQNRRLRKSKNKAATDPTKQANKQNQSTESKSGRKETIEMGI